MCRKKGLDIIQAIIKRIKENNSFERTMDKVKIISAENGKCSAEFTVETEHTNFGGTMHGGFSAMLVDMISTYAVMTQGKEVPGVSVDMHITYMKAAKLGDEVLVEAKTIKAGKTLAFLDVVIKNKTSGHIYVTGAHTKFVG